MASLFQPDVPAEDPAVAKQRMEEQARAKLANAASLQDQLQTETRLRTGRFGLRSLLGSFGSGNTPLGSG